jgi:glutamyl-tRNA reductase
MSIVVVGLSHRTAPVEVRDKVAISEQSVRSVLDRMIQLPGIQECTLISTCNRSEAYLVTDSLESSIESVIEHFSELAEVAASELRKHIFVHYDADAVKHLLGVASGLDSMILGEPQIAGQVKDAGAVGMETGSSKTILNRLFRTAVEASKRARTETEIGVGAVSISFAAVQLAKKILGDLKGRTALVIGAGEMSELTARHLVENGVNSLLVASRTHSRAQELAEKINGKALAWQDAMDNLHQADMVISSTSAPVYILQKSAVAEAMQRRRNQSMFLIDIAVPRDIDPAVGDLYNVFLYDIDDLQSVVGANLQKRQKEGEKANLIVEQEADAFASWLNSLEVVPTIVALRNHFQEVLDSELKQAKLQGFSEEQREKVIGLLRLYMNKLLHDPQTQLKAAADTGDGMAYVGALRQLFDLREEDVDEPPKQTREVQVERVHSE